MSRIEAIKARLRSATPGPWTVERDVWNVGDRKDNASHSIGSVCDPEGYFLATMENAARQRDNAELIANAPADLAHLIERVERLEAALRQVEWCSDSFDPSVTDLSYDLDLCPLCDQSEVRGHSPDCPVGLALTEDEPNGANA